MLVQFNHSFYHHKKLFGLKTPRMHYLQTFCSSSLALLLQSNFVSLHSCMQCIKLFDFTIVWYQFSKSATAHLPCLYDISCN